MKAWRFLLIGMLLTGCTGALSATPEPTLPPVKADTEVIAVEGVVEPAQWVTLRAGESTRVAEVLAAEGDGVRAGDALLRLDDTDARLAMQQAEAALAGARAQLDLVRAGARPEQLAALEAQIAVADAAISQTAALLAVARVGGTEADAADVQAAIAAADFAYRQATESHDDTMKCFDIPRPDGGTEKICPALGTFEEMTRAQMEAAQAALAAAQAQLAAIRGPAAATIAEAQAGIATAQARRDAAQAQLDLARSGATAENVASAEAAVKQAEAALAAARDLLDARTLDAPFEGVITDVAVQPGDATTTGSALVTLATLDRRHIRTKDLTELNVARVVEGQPVAVTFDAQPGQTFTGRVVRLDRQGQDYLGDVVYPVIIELAEMPAWAMWGMTAKGEVRMANSELRMTDDAPTTQPPNHLTTQPPIAEAIIEPERWAEVRFTVPGEVAEVLVQPNQRVVAGEVIARLDPLYADVAVRQTEAALAVAQAGLAQAQAGPRPETMAAAEAQVAAAEGDVARAVAARNQLTAAGRDAQLSAVRAQIAAAQAERRQLEAQWQWAKDDGDDERAQDMWEQIVVVDQRIAAAQARLATIPRVFAAQAQAADAGVRVAEAAYTATLAQLALAQAGPRAEEVAVAQAAVQQAEVARATAQAARARTELRAPFGGAVTQVLVEPGDLVTPERAVVVLATLDRVQAVTVDLLETDVTAVALGQAVTLRADALPGQIFAGRVARIEAQAVLYRGDVTYPVVIALEGDTAALWWGMKAVVEIGK
ncbi:MAG TPA: HlyD family efflux transporter periplasmic adaptor subunit [Anaerolineae bacterium]|nr:HlyD family efflux transporter periplasmic adaptor subunit [Anaerolineae bacterium]